MLLLLDNSWSKMAINIRKQLIQDADIIKNLLIQMAVIIKKQLIQNAIII